MMFQIMMFRIMMMERILLRRRGPYFYGPHVVLTLDG